MLSNILSNSILFKLVLFKLLFADILLGLRDEGGTKVNCSCFPLCDDVNYIIDTYVSACFLEFPVLHLGWNTETGRIFYILSWSYLRRKYYLVVVL